MLKIVGCTVLLMWASVAAGAEGAEGADVRALKAEVKMWKATANKLREENRQLKAKLLTLRRDLAAAEAGADGDVKKPEADKPDPEPEAVRTTPLASAFKPHEGEPLRIGPEDLIAFERKWHAKLNKKGLTRLQRDVLREQKSNVKSVLLAKQIKVTGTVREVGRNYVELENKTEKLEITAWIYGVPLKQAKQFRKGQTLTFTGRFGCDAVPERIGRMYQWRRHANGLSVWVTVEK